MDDAAGQFAGDIVANLMALGTNKANIDILAGVAVVKGDYLRLDLSKVNTKLGEGENVTTFGYTGFRMDAVRVTTQSTRLSTL
jgi:hypothetical protein